jgi:hypothetical protein|tara:strand:+ start:1035 stop:1370 length:336 start_codon:yes stop_codon:yes gene_type:complete
VPRREEEELSSGCAAWADGGGVDGGGGGGGAPADAARDFFFLPRRPFATLRFPRVLPFCFDFFTFDAFGSGSGASCCFGGLSNPNAAICARVRSSGAPLPLRLPLLIEMLP